MELEDLKQAWRVIQVAPKPNNEINEMDDREGKDRIASLRRKRSGSLVARMRRNLLGEVVLVVVMYVPAILYYMYGSGGRLSGLAWPLGLLLILFAGYSYRKDRLLKGMQQPEGQVRACLEVQVASLERYVRVYTLLGTIMVPVMAALTLVIVYANAAFAPGWKSLLPWAIALVPVAAGSYYANAWHVRKVYGRHIVKLKELLQEMDEP